MIRKLIGRVRRKSERWANVLEFFWDQKIWWLTPIAVVFLLLALVLLLTRNTTVAPFVYTFF